MRRLRTFCNIFMVVVICSSLGTLSLAQQAQKAETAQQRMKDVARSVTKRITELRGPVEKRREELDKAREELDQARDILDREIDKRRDYHYKVMDDGKEELYKAVEEARTNVSEERRRELDKIIKKKEKQIDAAAKGLEQELKGYEEALNEFAKALDEYAKALDGLEQVQEQEREQVKKELRELTKTLDYKRGSEVIALRDVELKVEAKTIGTVRKGEKLSVEDVKDNWLWVRNGEIHGWIDSRTVIRAALLAWYQRQPENSSVTESDRARANLYGVMFEIANPGSGPGMIVNLSQGNTADGVPMRMSVDAGYSKIKIILERVGDRSRAIFIKFDPPEGGAQSFPPRTKGDNYAVVQQGDYLRINTNSRQVFVNGELRKPQ